MKPLEEWIQKLLPLRRRQIEARYVQWDRAEKEISQIIREPHRPSDPLEAGELERRCVHSEILSALYQHIKYLSCEQHLWIPLLYALRKPIPDEIAFEFIRRQICLDGLDHTLQSEAVKWQLSPYEDNARLHVGARLYYEEEFSPEEFRAYLQRFSTNWLLFNCLSHCRASSDEKEFILMQFAQRLHSGRPILPLVDSRFRTYQEPEEREPEPPDPLFVEAQQTDLSPDRFRELRATQRPDILLALAENLTTLENILEELKELRNVVGAKPVRVAAKHTLWQLRRKRPRHFES